MALDVPRQAASVLVVDDEAAIRRVLQKILVSAGHTVDAVADGDACCVRLARGDVGVVLVDLLLGVESGIDLMRQIARDHPEVAVVAVTGVADAASVDAALDAGAAEYVTKPFKPADIEIAVRQALRRREAAAARAAEHRAMEQELRYRADFDSLTGLFNRRRFGEELERHLRRCSASGGEGALLICDLDHFKVVNDSLGHAAGDDVLRRTARILQAGVRDDDILARLGGDEFAVVVTNIRQDGAMRIADELQTRLGDPSARPATGASIGVACFCGDEGVVADDLMVAADAALYEAKEAGRNAVVRFDGPKASSLTWIDRIRRALDHDQLALHTQPIVDLRSGDVVQEELLIRMIDTDGSVIAPGSFLPTAERFGLIEELDAWTLRNALEVAARGRSVNVNISARTLQDGRLVETIEAGVRDGVRARNVTIEITETSAISNITLVRELADRLTALGCRLALDDFGTGFGTFMYLKHLPIDFIKIDRDFVRDLASSRVDQRMIKAIVEIARAAGQQTIAEGVEDVMALDLLRRFGVDFAQGYYLARPAPLEAAPPSLACGVTKLYGALAKTAAA